MTILLWEPTGAIEATVLHSCTGQSGVARPRQAVDGGRTCRTLLPVRQKIGDWRHVKERKIEKETGVYFIFHTCCQNELTERLSSVQNFTLLNKK